MKKNQAGKGGVCCAVLVLLIVPVFHDCAKKAGNLPESGDDMNGPVFSGGNDQDVPVPEPPKPVTFEGLDAETVMRIKRDFMYKIDEGSHGTWMSNHTIDDVFLKRYFGTYNGWEIVVLDAYGLIHIRMVPPISIWRQKDGSIYTVPEAHHLGLLTADDVKSINEMIRRLNFPQKDRQGGKP